MTKPTAIRRGTPERQEAILEAALACFTEQGIEATTINDIRAQARCSIGSIYHHFGNKEGIASRLFIGGIKQLNQDLLLQLNQCTEAQSGVRVVVTQYAEWVTSHKALARFLLQSRQIQFPNIVQSEVRDTHHAHIQKVFEWFAPWVVNGSMKVLPVEAYIPIISGPIQEYTRRWLAGQVKASPDQMKQVFADAAWNSVRV